MRIMQFIFAKLMLLKLVRKRALKGDVIAQYELGRRLNKLGLEHWPEAYSWLKVAADQGHEDAQSTVATIEAKLPLELLNMGRELAKQHKTQIKRNRRA